MRNITLYEGGKPRKLPSVAQAETDPQGNGERVLWVPAVDYLGMDKHISENGTYKVEDEVGQNGRGFWAYTKVTVNVYGGAAGLESEDHEQTDPDEWDTDDPSDPQWPEEAGEASVQEVEPAGTTDPKGNVKKGAITGKDPVTGEKKTVKVTEVKDPVTGKKKAVLEEVEVPKAIHITALPDKMDYLIGEHIDFSGIEVTLYKKFEEHSSGGSTTVDAIPFRDSWYPDGKIPFDELTFWPTTAMSDAVDSWVIGNTAAEVYSADEFIAYLQPKTLDAKGNTVSVAFGNRLWNKINDGKALAFFVHNNGPYEGPVLVSPSRSSSACRMTTGSGAPFSLNVRHVVVDGFSWYTMSDYHVDTDSYFVDPWICSLPTFDAGGTGIANADNLRKALKTFRAERYDGNGILVSWKSPYDGETLTTRLHIDMK